MAYNVSALTDYVIENEDLLVMKSLYSSKTKSLIQSEGNIMTGVKSSEQINITDTDAIFQDGSACGFTSSGNTSFSQRKVEVGAIKVNEALCPKALNTKYTQKKLQAGSRQDKIPFEEQYAELKANAISTNLEKGIWQGDKASNDANLKRFDGLIKIIDASAAAVNSNVAAYTTGAPILVATGITEANVRAVVNGVYKALPVNIQGKEDIRIFCGWDVFTKYVASYTDANLFHFSPDGKELKQEVGEVVIPGTFYRLTAVHGLDNTNRLFGLRMSNLYEGTDLENEEERFEIFYAKEADEVRFIAEFKEGVQVAFPNEISTFKLQ